MQERIRYVLYVLLFIITATICYQQSISQHNRAFGHIERSVFSQPSTHSDKMIDHYRHSMVASEITNTISTTNPEHKFIILHQLSAIYGTAMRPALAQAIFRRSAELNLRSVEYYVFSLRRIVV